MSCNFLKLNSGKTEVVVLGTYQQLAKLNIQGLSVAGIQVNVQQNPVRNLGVMFDRNMTMEDQVSSIIRSVSYHMRNISRIRRHITADSAKKLIHSLVTSRLDYCNSLLVGISGKLMLRLERAQSWAARIILQLPRSVTPELHLLHWLPVKARVNYKLAVLMFKAIRGPAPEYISSLVSTYCTRRTLRSSDTNLSNVPHSRHPRAGDRCFKVAGPIMWNKLPNGLRAITDFNTFKKHLKTYLFKDTFYVKRQ